MVKSSKSVNSRDLLNGIEKGGGGELRLNLVKHEYIDTTIWKVSSWWKV